VAVACHPARATANAGPRPGPEPRWTARAHGQRAHVHQTLDVLGRMAAEIPQVALHRAETQGRLTLDRGLSHPCTSRSEP